jgi:hypothetical protein
MIRYDRLEGELERLRNQYASAQPFPHIALDDFLDPAAADTAFARFPPLASMDSLRDYRQVKAQDPSVNKFDPIFGRIIFEHLHSERFLRFVSRLTGIERLEADPQLYAAGLAQGGNDSFLNVHIDNSSHPTQPLYRRVNILVYLNKSWSEAKGGHFEVWDRAIQRCEAILPVFNRAVIFTVSQRSWHGYRKVVTPDGDTRKSINIYYFTKESPTGTDYHHVTSFRARPGETKNRFLYPVDNALRTLYRMVRRKKDGHAVLFSDGDPHRRGGNGSDR